MEDKARRKERSKWQDKMRALQERHEVDESEAMHVIAEARAMMEHMSRAEHQMRAEGEKKSSRLEEEARRDAQQRQQQVLDTEEAASLKLHSFEMLAERSAEDYLARETGLRIQKAE